MAANPSLTCEVVERELAVPSGAVASESLAEHVAACARCAQQAEAGRRLDAAWLATRPEVPDHNAWAALWSQMDDAMPARAAARRWDAATPRPSARDGGRRPWAAVWAVAAVAQVAAAGIAYLALTRPAAVAPADPTPTVAMLAPAPVAAPADSVAQVEYELDAGQTLFLVLDERADHVVVHPRAIATADLVAFDGETPDPLANAVQVDMELLNAFEAME
jgi:hypothetical protein